MGGLTPVTRGQLMDVWDDINGDGWAKSGHGNCYCISREAYPELHEAAGSYNIVFVIEHVKLANERWAYVSCLGHVILPPYRVSEVWVEPVDPWERS